MSELAHQAFELTPEQREIQQVCREFAEREIRPISLAVDEADTEMPWEIWHKAAELGITSFMLPEEHGGGGMTDITTALASTGIDVNAATYFTQRLSMARRATQLAPRVAAVLEGGYNLATLPRLVEAALSGFEAG